MALTVPCAHCNGSGHRNLTDIESATLAALGDEWRTSTEIRSRLAVELTAPATVMRLQSLYLFGLIDRKLATRGYYAWRLRQ